MNTYEITLHDAVKHIRITASDAFEALRTARARYGGAADITDISVMSRDLAKRKCIRTVLYTKNADGNVIRGSVLL